MGIARLVIELILLVYRKFTQVVMSNYSTDVGVLSQRSLVELAVVRENSQFWGSPKKIYWRDKY